MGTLHEDVNAYLAQRKPRPEMRWRRAAYWMFLRWQVEQDRVDWPAVTEMPLETTDKRN